MTTNITDEIKDAFNALTSGGYDNFVLFSCFVNGEPTATICTVVQHGEETRINPLFVAVTPGMILTDHDGQSAEK